MKIILAIVVAVLLATWLLILSGTGGESPVEAATPGTDWVSPYFADIPAVGMYTLVSVLNADTANVTTTTSFYDSTGSKVGESVELIVPDATAIFSTASGFTSQISAVVDV